VLVEDSLWGSFRRCHCLACWRAANCLESLSNVVTAWLTEGPSPYSPLTRSLAPEGYGQTLSRLMMLLGTTLVQQ